MEINLPTAIRILDIKYLSEYFFIDYHENKKMEYAYVSAFRDFNELKIKARLCKRLGKKKSAFLELGAGLEIVRTKKCAFAGLSSFKEAYILADRVNSLLGKKTGDIQTLYIKAYSEGKPLEDDLPVSLQVNFMLGFLDESSLRVPDYSEEDRQHYLASLKSLSDDLNNLKSLSCLSYNFFKV